MTKRITRLPKDSLSPLLSGNGEGVALDIDIAGPLDIGLGGHQYLLVGIEKWSKIAFAIPINTRRDAWNTVEQCIHPLEKELGERVRVLRSDGAPEFTDSNRARDFVRLSGIQQYTSPPHSQALNGLAERQVRTVKEMVGCLLMDGGLTHEYWPFAARY